MAESKWLLFKSQVCSGLICKLSLYSSRRLAYTFG